MFEKFTDRARRTMGLARQEAERLGHDEVRSRADEMMGGVPSTGRKREVAADV